MCVCLCVCVYVCWIDTVLPLGVAIKMYTRINFVFCCIPQQSTVVSPRRRLDLWIGYIKCFYCWHEVNIRFTCSRAKLLNLRVLSGHTMLTHYNESTSISS